MKPVLVGAVIACALIALVLLMFPPGAEETPFGSGIETACLLYTSDAADE